MASESSKLTATDDRRLPSIFWMVGGDLARRDDRERLRLPPLRTQTRHANSKRTLEPSLPTNDQSSRYVPSSPTDLNSALESPVQISHPPATTRQRSVSCSSSSTLLSCRDSCFDSSPRLSSSPQIQANGSEITRYEPSTNGLIIREQPVAARACGFGERDRRMVDPPPIIELNPSEDTWPTGQERYSSLLVRCHLSSRDGKKDMDVLDDYRTGTPIPYLVGTTVASPHQVKDNHGIRGTFFVFPGMSCRLPGQYRLCFTLIGIDFAAPSHGPSAKVLATVMSEVFTVYTARDFPGMRANSDLLNVLREQGVYAGTRRRVSGRNSMAQPAQQADYSDLSRAEHDDDEHEEEER